MVELTVPDLAAAMRAAVRGLVDRLDTEQRRQLVFGFDQIADSRPHRRGEIRHGELDHAANLAAGFGGKRGRQQG